MVREMDEILRHPIAQPAKSCESKDGVSFLDQVICPLYEVLAAVCLLLFFVSSKISNGRVGFIFLFSLKSRSECVHMSS